MNSYPILGMIGRKLQCEVWCFEQNFDKSGFDDFWFVLSIVAFVLLFLFNFDYSSEPRNRNIHTAKIFELVELEIIWRKSDFPVLMFYFLAFI